MSRPRARGMGESVPVLAEAIEDGHDGGGRIGVEDVTLAIEKEQAVSTRCKSKSDIEASGEPARSSTTTPEEAASSSLQPPSAISSFSREPDKNRARASLVTGGKRTESRTTTANELERTGGCREDLPERTKDTV
jgi:hypothetical protein